MLWIALSCLLSIVLLAMRVAFTGSIVYAFLVWNLFLAAVPVLFSSMALSLGRSGRVWLACGMLVPWLLFFPNAPYILTDLLHLKPRGEVPLWYDMMLLLSFALNGLFIAFLSLRQVELLLKAMFSVRVARVAPVVVLFLAGYGIYLGRFLRLNSWEVMTAPRAVGHSMLGHMLDPFAHPRAWVVTFMVGLMLLMGYRILGVLARMGEAPRSG